MRLWSMPDVQRGARRTSGDHNLDRFLTAAVICVLAVATASAQSSPEAQLDGEAIVVGAGISGLSAAVELGRNGVDVLVVEMNSVPGGPAVRAGGFAIAGTTPVQAEAGYEDSPELAYRDWMAWTETGDPQWIRYYAENSREMIYDWISGMGVEFVRVQGGYENSVPRFHFTQHGALDVVLALLRTALRLPDVAFLFNHRVERLIVTGDRVTGVEVQNLRTGESRALNAEHVVLATGGFEGDLERALENWMPDLPRPDRLLVGSSMHAMGQGLDLSTGAGAALTDLRRQYIYINGIVNVRDPSGTSAVTAGNDYSMWVNAQGLRFTNETGPDKSILAHLLDQEPATYWAIFDETTRSEFSMRGVEWLKNPMDGHPVLDDPDSTARSSTLEGLAELSGLPANALVASVQRFNAMIEAGEDADFARFASREEAPPKIEQPPFYALQFFPMTRKSMGGVAIDMRGRALNARGEVVPGLYAIGELTGSVGINGKHGMDGMFLGPAVLTGHLVGRTIAAEQGSRADPVSTKAAVAEEPLPDAAGWDATLTAEDLQALLAAGREGYWHFRVSHEMVLERRYECTRCHSPEVPFAPVNNRASKLALAELCSNCHGR